MGCKGSKATITDTNQTPQDGTQPAPKENNNDAEKSAPAPDDNGNNSAGNEFIAKEHNECNVNVLTNNFNANCQSVMPERINNLKFHQYTETKTRNSDNDNYSSFTIESQPLSVRQNPLIDSENNVATLTIEELPPNANLENFIVNSLGDKNDGQCCVIIQSTMEKNDFKSESIPGRSSPDYEDFRMPDPTGAESSVAVPLEDVPSIDKSSRPVRSRLQQNSNESGDKIESRGSDDVISTKKNYHKARILITQNEDNNQAEKDSKTVTQKIES